MGRLILGGALTALLLVAAAIVIIVLLSFLNAQDDQAEAIYQSCIESGKSENICAALHGGVPDRSP